MKQMKTLFVVVGCLSFLVGCGPSPQAVCEENMVVTCERMWTCDAAAKIGSDVESCKSSAKGLCAIAVASSSYDLSKAEQCTKDTKAQSCEAYNAGKATSCN